MQWPDTVQIRNDTRISKPVNCSYVVRLSSPIIHVSTTMQSLNRTPTGSDAETILTFGLLQDHRISILDGENVSPSLRRHDCIISF